MYEALIRLLRVKDLREISVKEIVGRSGYSRSTFYAHFSGKDDLVRAMIDEEIDRYVRIVLNLLRRLKGAILVNDRQGNLDFFEAIYEHQDVYKIIVNSKVMEESFIYFYKNVVSKFNQNTDIVMDKDLPGIDMNLCNSIYTGSYLLFIKYCADTDFRYPPKYMAEQATMILYNKPNKAYVMGD
jgi:hypothetical protein